jgi:type I restriction enzyme S subunit
MTQVEQQIFPTEWLNTDIGSFAPLQRGFDLPNRERIEGKYPVVYSNGVMNFHHKYQVKGPGVVTGRSGTIGKVHYVEKDYWPHNTALWVKEFNNAVPKFVYYLYSHLDFKRFSSGSGVPTLNRNDAHSFAINVPSKKEEQTAIANALSDVDALLTELENLIAKKQAIKTATMQQLLTGKTRLPQFATHTEGEKKGQPKGTIPSELGEIPEDWGIKKLGELGKFKNGINKDADSFGHGSLFINLMDVFGKPKINGNENFGLINSSPLEQKEYSILEGDVLFIRSSVKPSGVGLTSVAKVNIKKAVYSGFLIRFRSNKTLNDEFKVHCFYENKFRKRIISASTVSANTNINQEALKEILIAFPSNIEEQAAISNILSDMDNEIQTLEHHLKKTRQIKQGMMQELLTGKTRLPF